MCLCHHKEFELCTVVGGEGWMTNISININININIRKIATRENRISMAKDDHCFSLP